MHAAAWPVLQRLAPALLLVSVRMCDRKPVHKGKFIDLDFDPLDDDILVGEPLPPELGPDYVHPDARSVILTEEDYERFGRYGEHIDWDIDFARLPRRVRSPPIKPAPVEPRPTPHEIRAPRKAEEAARKVEEAEHREERLLTLQDAGMSRSAAKATARAFPRLHKIPLRTFRERVQDVEAVLTTPGAAANVLRHAPSILLHSQLRETLPAKVELVERATGIAAQRVPFQAPSLLTLNTTNLNERFVRIQQALPAMELDDDGLRRMLKLCPRLLSYKPETLRTRFEELRLQLPPGANAAKIVRQQPALLGTDPSLLAPKVALLRELCTDDEFRGLAGSSSFARALTSSLEVLERLRSLPPRADGSPRPIMSGWCAPSTIVNPLPPAPRVPTPPCIRIARSHYEISILARRAHSILKSRKEWEALRGRGARGILGAGGDGGR